MYVATNTQIEQCLLMCLNKGWKIRNQSIQ